MTELAVAADNTHIQFPEVPNVRLDSFIGEPNPDSPKTLFSIYIPAKHQAKDLSIVRMQDCDLTHILQGAKMDYRDRTKFTVPTEAGPCAVKLHFLIFPNREDEIQIDYTYTIPRQFGDLQEHEFKRCERINQEVGRRIHGNTSLKHGIGDFASIVHDLVCEFIDNTYFSSMSEGKQPDYLKTTPPPQQI